jgi:hypothetical protein
MPDLLRETQIGPYSVRLRQRRPDERTIYATEYSIQCFTGLNVVRLPDCYAYGDDRDYMDRKWNSITENVGYYVA